MHKTINTSIVLAVFSMIAFLFFLNSCDSLNGPEEKENTQYSFNYEIYNEQGELSASVTDKQIDNQSVKASAGYFGSEFFPSWLLESVTENSPIEPEDLKKKQIYLHAETELQETLKTYSLRLNFPNLQQWKPGEYHLPNISKEKHLELLRMMWETQQNSPLPKKSVQSQLFKSNKTDETKQTASIDYSESGFMTETTYGIKIDRTGLLYQSTKGSIKLTHVSDDVVEGNFTVELAGFPMEILFFSDEFPENPELEMFTITGNFKAIPGDYYDLVESSDVLIH